MENSELDFIIDSVDTFNIVKLEKSYEIIAEILNDVLSKYFDLCDFDTLSAIKRKVLERYKEWLDNGK